MLHAKRVQRRRPLFSDNLQGCLEGGFLDKFRSLMQAARRPFDLNALHLAGAQEQVVSAVDQDLDQHAVHYRRLDRSGARDLDAAEAAGRRRSSERRRSLEFAERRVGYLPATSGVIRRTVTRRFCSLGPCTGTLSCCSP